MCPAAATLPDDSACAEKRRRARRLVGAIIVFSGIVAFGIGLTLYWGIRQQRGPGRAVSATVTRVEPAAAGSVQVFVRLEDSALPIEDEYLLPSDDQEPVRAPGEKFEVWYDRDGRPKEIQRYDSGLPLPSIVLALMGLLDLIFGIVILNFGLPADWKARQKDLDTDAANPYNRPV